MDALQIFPVLLALMSATLAALGYALHRLEQLPNQPNASSLPTLQCSQCGHRLAIGWRHCPGCGMPIQSVAPLSGMAQQGAEVAGPHGLANRQ